MASKNDQSAIELLNGEAILHSQLFSFIRPMCLKWAVELGIADIIHNHGKPITIPELILALVQVPPAKASLVKRFMRFLAHNGIFEIHESLEEEHETYSLTPASKLLVNGSDHCLTPFVLWATDPVRINNYHHLGNWVCGEVPTLYETALGISLWEYLDKNPEYMSRFNEGMASDCQLLKLTLKDCSSVFEGLDTIVDVGGGNGTVAKIISQLFPKLKLVVFDLPQVVGNLSGTNNVSYVAGDMFVSIPQADAVVLKRILHDWTDEDCIKILKKCKNSISSKKGKVIIIEAIINENQEDKVMTETKLTTDIMMMTINGKERNEKEWKELFVAAGFKHYKIYQLHGLRSLIEVYP
ncbi:hypothetical protein Lal_00021555 [Lupinus albus]|uniref:isoflavone 7-O-methyltransferase n=1 Tax=Lupinus albus TaxID=3870 RepID=A0A6A4NFV4_LUPAL|nr:putative isoflavone 7-O-methyltransferase [Lupinus albus]KAF1860512.1 hypothetical protein Lal_00021555 [Lupinus albus]